MSKNYVDLIFHSIALFLCFLVCCSNDPIESPPSNGTEQDLMIDEKLLLDISSSVNPWFASADEGVFDLSNLEVVTSGRVNDLELSYVAINAWDADVFAFNNQTGKWDRLATGGACETCNPNRKYVTFSIRGLAATDYIDQTLSVRIKGFTQVDLNSTTSILALEFNPKYKPVPLTVGYGGFEYYGGFLFVSNNDVDILSTTGLNVKSIETPMAWSCAMTMRNGRIWVVGTVNNVNGIHELKRDGTLRQGFSLGNLFCCGMTAIAGQMWLLISEDAQQRVVEVDVEASLNDGTIVIKRGFDRGDYSGEAITTDGTNLYLYRGAQIRSIDVLSFEGEIVNSFDVDIKWVGGMTWDQGSLWILHSGPGRVHTGYVINKFVLP